MADADARRVGRLNEPTGLARDDRPGAGGAFTETRAHNKDGVTMRWQTFSETNHYGFQVLRSADGGATIETVGEVIPARGSEVEGAEYEFVDAIGRLSGTVSYWLEDIDLDGTVTSHAPVTVELQPFREQRGNPDDPERRGP